MAAEARLADAVPVALLGRADPAREQLRHALAELGAAIVFEGEPATVDAAQLLGSGARVLLVNLEAGVEDDLDHLQSLFDDPGLSVVFNEGDVTSQLAGWDLARWARHLAVKALGRQDVNPPRPAGAEALPSHEMLPVPGAPPTPAELSDHFRLESFTEEAAANADDVPSTPSLMPERDDAAVEPQGLDSEGPARAALGGIDFDEIAGAMLGLADDEQSPAPSTAEQGAPKQQEGATAVGDGSSVRPGEDDEEFSFDLDLSSLDEAISSDRRAVAAPAPRDVVSDEAPALDPQTEALLQDEGEFEVAVDFSGFRNDDDEGDGEIELDDDLAALAAQLDESEADGGGSALIDLRFDSVDDFDAPEESPQREPATAGPDPVTTTVAAAAGERTTFDFGALELAPVDEVEVSATVQSPSPRAQPSSSGAGDELALDALGLDEAGPDTTPATPAAGAAARSAFGDLRLEDMELGDPDAAPAPLAPAPAAVASPAPARAAPAGGALAMDNLDSLLAGLELAPMEDAEPGSAALQRVIVLGASIGGPDALRTFLGSIPEGFPALFILVQHLDNGFFERLATQLQKATRMPVRVPDPTRRAAHGQVLVATDDHRLLIEADGSVELRGHPQAPRYKPCIDDVLCDVADRFGANATAIIFSGMAGDAVEGAVHLTGKGGEVWVQDPDSCVVSSMVDGARARGVVKFTGTPRELAEQCVARYGKG